MKNNEEGWEMIMKDYILALEEKHQGEVRDLEKQISLLKKLILERIGSSLKTKIF